MVVAGGLTFFSAYDIWGETFGMIRKIPHVFFVSCFTTPQGIGAFCSKRFFKSPKNIVSSMGWGRTYRQW